MSQTKSADLRPQPRSTSLNDVAERAGAARLTGPDAFVTGITHDSRAVRPGDLYAALPGAHTHGARFIDAVITAGAAAVLTDPEGADIIGISPVPVVVVEEVRTRVGHVASLIYGDPSRHLRVVGITGTNGKTTCTWMVEAALKAAGVGAAVIGTAGVRLGDSVIPSARTTPEAPELQALLAVLRERGAEVVAMEVSSHALELHRVDGTWFEVVGFTHLTQDHLDFHETMENYYQAKRRLFSVEFAARGEVVIDDDWGQRLASESAIPVRTISTCGIAADWTVTDVVHTDRSGQEFHLADASGTSLDVSITLAGQFNIANAALAVALVSELDVSIDDAVAGLAGVSVPGRMEQVVVPGAPLGIVDYAHTPDAVARAVAAASRANQRLVVVLGAGGDRDVEKRPLMGAAASELADVVVITDDNPRSEDPALIRASVASGTDDQRARIVDVAGRGIAITAAVDLAGPNGVVLLLGKGHETGQEIAGVMHPFDDRAELRAALELFAASGKPA